MTLTELHGAQVVASGGHAGTVDDIILHAGSWAVRYLVLFSGYAGACRRIVLPPQHVSVSRRGDGTPRLEVAREELRAAAFPLGRAAGEPGLCAGRSLLGWSIHSAAPIRGRVADLAIDPCGWRVAGVVLDGALLAGPEAIPADAIYCLDWKERSLAVRLPRGAPTRRCVRDVLLADS